MLEQTQLALKDAQAQMVWDIFRRINRIPRCSKNEQRIVEWLRDVARERGLVCRTDSTGNTVMELPPANGCEDAPGVVLQSHVDMVCEKELDFSHDFSKDPIEIIDRNGWVYANGTTLGADNGVGMALALALASETGLRHPRLELLFTVDEETGLTGANAIRQGFITGKYFINLDSEDESFIVGCAGGERTMIQLPLEWKPAPESSECFELRVSGLQGGHSGIDIDKSRANALQLLARVLDSLLYRFGLDVCMIQGGRADNAIPRDAAACICCPTSDLDQIMRSTDDTETLFKEEFSRTDPSLKVDLIAQPAGKCKIVWSGGCAEKAVKMLLAMPTGVYRVSRQFRDTVETSSNLARVETDRDRNMLVVTTSQRSFRASSLDEMTSKVTAVAQLAGATVMTTGRYPHWMPDAGSVLLGQAIETYKKLRGKEPEVKVIHAGLECGVIGKKIPGLDMISVGPVIQNPHSPQERVNIASVDSTWTFLLNLLPALK